MSSNDLQSAISGAYIVMLLQHLDKHDGTRASVIHLRDRIMGKLVYLPNLVSKLADEAYDLTKQRYIDKKIGMDIGILIETIAFNKEEYMKKFYGNDFITLVSRASVKLQLDGLTPKQMKDTYRVADEMKTDMEKTVYEYLKG